MFCPLSEGTGAKGVIVVGYEGQDLERVRERQARKLKEAERYRPSQGKRKTGLGFSDMMRKAIGQPGDLPDTAAKLGETEADKEAQAERNAARQLYRLSLWSPLLSVMGLVVFAPLAIPYLLFTGYRSRHAFVRWHTAQWTLLTLVAFFVAVPALMSDLTLFVVALGGWYLGNLIGSRQVNRGECWLWRWWNDAAELPRPWAVAPDAALAPTASAPLVTPGETLPSPIRAEPVPAVRAEAQAAFAQGMTLARQGQQGEAVACFLTAFREGSLLLRRRAVRELEKLGEVETF